MAQIILRDAFIKEMQAEYKSTKKCLERVPENLFEYKPHPKSMNLGYLSLLVAEIPRWISVTIEKGVVDFATFTHQAAKTNQELMDQFENNFEGAIVALQQTDDKKMDAPFTLQNKDQILMKTSIVESVGSTINHWVHHRGQLTVYLRLNDIAVPSIYGPSADDPNF